MLEWLQTLWASNRWRLIAVSFLAITINLIYPVIPEEMIEENIHQFVALVILIITGVGADSYRRLGTRD